MRRKVDADDLPMHWEQRHVLSFGRNHRTNFERMKKERAVEEWTLYNDLSEASAPLAVVCICGLFYTVLRARFPPPFVAFEELVVVFVNIFVQEKRV